MRKKKIIAIMLTMTLAFGGIAPGHTFDMFHSSSMVVNAATTTEDMVKELANPVNQAELSSITSCNYSAITVSEERLLQIGDAIVVSDGTTNSLLFYLGEKKALKKSDAATYTLVTYTFDTTHDFYRYQKQIPSFTAPTPITCTYGQYLNELALADGFEWKNPNERITKVGENTYLAKYVPSNTLMYEIVEDVPIVLNIEKQTLSTLTAPTVDEALTYSPSMTLGDITLPPDWAWEDATIVPTCDITEYNAVFTPVNADGYELPENTETTLPVTIELSKATVDCVESAMYTVKKGTWLSDITLPSNAYGTYSFEQEDAILNDIGEFSYSLKFTPSDIVNYETIENIPVIIYVVAEDVEIPDVSGFKGTYGQSLNEIKLPTNWTWATPDTKLTTIGTFEYPAIYTVNGKSTTINLTVIVSKAIGETVVAPSSFVVTWNGSLSTDIVSLPKNWSFVGISELQMGTHNYNIVYTPTDTEHYDYSNQELTSVMSVTVNKAVPNYAYPPKIQLDEGKALTNSMLPTSDNGQYIWTSNKNVTKSGTYYCKFTPSDTEHYYVVTDIPVSVTLKAKATSTEPPTTDSDNKDKESSSSSGGNKKDQSTDYDDYGDYGKNTTEDSGSSSLEDKDDDDIEIENDNKDYAQNTTEAYKVRPATTESTGTTESISTEQITTTRVAEDTTEESETETEPVKDGKGFPMWIILIVLVIGGGAGAFVYVSSKKSGPTDSGF